MGVTKAERPIDNSISKNLFLKNCLPNISNYCSFAGSNVFFHYNGPQDVPRHLKVVMT